MNTMQSKRPAEPREQLAEPRPPAPPARRPQDNASDMLSDMLPPLLGVLVGVIVIAAVGLFLGGPAGGLAALSAALLGSHSAWYLSRASAFVAYILLWLSMALGLSITNRMARVSPGGPIVGDLHEHASLLGV